MKTKTWLINFVIICVWGSACLPAFADTVVYSEDFSSDPGWITDQPTKFYWDSTTQTYHVRSENNSPALGLNRYFYKLLPEPVGSFVLQWDVKITYEDWSCGLAFGLWDNTFSDLSVPGGQTIYFVSGISDPGRYMSLVVKGPGGTTQIGSPPNSYSLNQWYTIALSYDADGNTVNCKVVVRDTGATVWTSNSVSVPGGNFTEELKYLGGTRRTGYNGTYPGLSPWAVAEGYIDNVVLSIPGPSELTVSIDIKPGSCPNPLNVKDKGVLSVAILGSEDFDVRTINTASIRLEGVAPVRSSYEDVATPMPEGADWCECTMEGPDGYLDLVLKFNVKDIVTALGQVNSGDELDLTLTGALAEAFGGTPIEGTDCVVIIAKGKS